MKYIHGQFINYTNSKTYEVRIYNNDGSNTTQEKTIEDDGTIYFGPSPVDITINCDSLFTHIIKKSCTINITTNEYLVDWLYATNQKDVTVEIYEENNLIFSGYAEPNIFNMGYAHTFDDIQINAIDNLSLLQYNKLTDNTDYNTAKKVAKIKTFKDIILTDIGLSNVYYDSSKRLPGSNNSIFEDLAISELIFFGETEDKMMNNEEILFELLQYLNLHIIQEGNKYFIFDWNSKKDPYIIWSNINDGTILRTDTISTIAVTKNDYTSDDTNISVDDIYNQIQVKCDIEKTETVIESPLDDNKLISQFDNYQKFMTEIFSLLTTNNFGNEMIECLYRFKYLVDNEDPGSLADNNKAWIRDWFFKIKENPDWTFYHNGTDIYQANYTDDSNGKKIDQWKFLKYLRQNRFASCIMSLAKGLKRQPSDLDDAGLNFSDTLVISVNGENLDNQETALNNMKTDLAAASPMIEYNGNTNGIYSPNDSGTTNYLVFRGQITLVPSIGQSGLTYDDDYSYADRSDNKFTDTKYQLDNMSGNITSFMLSTELNYGGENGCYLINKYWEQEKTIKDEPYVGNPYYNYWYPLTDLTNIENTAIKYNLSEIDGENYKINKVPVLECELKIGDKYCVETFVQDTGGDYKNSNFEWLTAAECASRGLTPTFSLGFKPNIGDVIIGKEFNLQTNFDYTWNIGAENGTAIPITRGDNLQGQVQFKILGLINSTWDTELTRKKSWLDWVLRTPNSLSILNYVSSVMIKNFECKIYSDNNGYATNTDNDLIYLSDEATEYIKVKDDIEMKINTALTSEDAHNYGINNSVNLSSVINHNTGYAIEEIEEISSQEEAKPEELYCNYYYNAYSSPKLILETDLKDSSNISYFNCYTFSYFAGKIFHIISMTHDLKYNTKHIKLREI